MSNGGIKMKCSNPACITAGGPHYRKSNASGIFVCRACGSDLVLYNSNRKDTKFNDKARKELEDELRT